MNQLANSSFDKISQIYVKYFSLGFIGTKKLEDKLAIIALTCYITNEFKKKGKKVNCYDVLLKVGNDCNQRVKDTFLKALGAMCEDLLYGCDSFPDFGLKPQEMPKTLKKLIDEYVPF